MRFLLAHSQSNFFYSVFVDVSQFFFQAAVFRNPRFNFFVDPFRISVSVSDSFAAGMHGKCVFCFYTAQSCFFKE